MNADSGPNGARPSATVGQLREQIAEDRRELAETVTALHHKTDVKRRVREKAADAEIAAADVASWVGHTAGTVPRLAKQVAATAAGRVRSKVPQPVRTPMEQTVGLLRRDLRIVVAVVAAIMAASVVWARRHNRC